MSFFKRCVISIRRNLSKVLPLFLIVQILGNILCAAVAINQSTLKTKEEFEKTFGTKITLDYQEGYRNKGYLGGTKEYNNVDFLFSELNKLEYYDYSNISYLNTYFSSSNLKYSEKETFYYEKDMMPLFLWGISNEVPIDEKIYNIELIDGRHFTSDELENADRVIIVSENFKIKENNDIRNVQIGDFISIDSVFYSQEDFSLNYIETHWYEVVGIYIRTNNIQTIEDGYNEDNNLTRIYLPLNTLQKEIEFYNRLNKQFGNGINANSVPIQAYFQLKDIKLQNKFLKKYASFVPNANQQPEDFYIETCNELYSKISFPIASLSNIASLTLIISTIVTILVLILLILILLKNRKQEIGILFALGERKYRIILQMILEIYLVGILALSISTFSGCKIGKHLSTMLINDDNKIELTLEEKQNQLALIEYYQVDYTKEYFGQVFVTGSIIMIVSVIFPIRYILRLNPKKILM